MDKSEIGKLLSEIRKKEEMSINEVSTLSKLQPSQIKDMESGSKNYTIDSLLKYAKVLYLTVKLEAE